jgi:histidinol-phosphate aminotransferase
VIDALMRMRGPFNLSTAALAAAEAAVRDTAHTDFCRRQNAVNRAALAEGLARAGVPSDPPEANYLLARFRDRAEAEACDLHLRERGIIVRRVAGYNLPAALRISVGDAAGCARVVEAVAEFTKVRA